MKELNAYVDQKNRWNTILNYPQLSLSSKADRQKIAESIDAALSPENLTCDGELPRKEVEASYKRLITVAQQLNKLDPEAAKAIYELYTGE